MRFVPTIVFLVCLGMAVAENQAKLVANYRIAATYDAANKSLTGHETLTWTNDSPDTIPDLRFHLYMNAFKNEKSTFIRESGGALRSDHIEKDSDPWGWIDVKSIRIAGLDLAKSIQFIHPDDNNADDQTVIRVPYTVKPGETISIGIDWETKFPKVFARTGYAGTFLLAGQWFPKIGVWEKAGDRYATVGAWNTHQFHANSEFFADYGTYDVDLIVPSNEVIGATGVLTNKSVNGATTTYSFHQSNVHDFAWTIQPNFLKLERKFEASKQVTGKELETVAKRHGISMDEARLTDVDVTLLLQPEHAEQANRHFDSAFAAIKWFGLWYGNYPHKTLTIVDPPANGNGAGGMEYPTFITAGTHLYSAPHNGDPEEVTVHEFGHQFWQGQVGTNEFEEAWMDEGFNTYSTGKVMDLVYGRRELPLSAFGVPLGWFMHLPSTDTLETNRAAYIGIGPKQDDLARFAWQYRNDNSYGSNSYMRPSLMLSTLENLLGSGVMERVMRVYQQKFRYRHPAAPDFIRTVNEVSGRDMDWYFKQTVYSSNAVDYRVDSATSTPVKTFLGVFEKDGKKVTVSEKDAEKQDKGQKEQFKNTIVVRRDGEAIIPVDVLIQFKNGESVTEHWDGAYRWIKYEYVKPTEVSSVVVDPGHKLALDINFTNNSWTADPSPAPIFKWGSTLLFWIQNALHVASMVS